MQNIAVYLNEKASNSSGQNWQKKIRNTLFRSNLSFRSPDNLNDLYESLQKDIENGVDAFISVGGDGTVNTLIQNMAYSNAGLLVIPGGTANDLASELGNNVRIKKVLQTIRNQKFKKIDLIKINNRLMATNGGIGLGGTVAHKINSLRSAFPFFKKMMRLSGKNIYSFFIAQELLSMRFKTYDIFLDSKELTGNFKACAVLINNQSRLAGTFDVAPSTANDDGLFNVTILTHPNRNKLISCIIKIALGQYPHDDPHFISYETSSLKLVNNDDCHLDFFGDGEVFKSSKEFDISISKKALKVFSYDTGSKELPEQGLFPNISITH